MAEVGGFRRLTISADGSDRAWPQRVMPKTDAAHFHYVASGKLTIARELAARTAVALFHNHLIVDAVGAVFPFGTKAFSRLRAPFWMTAFDEAVRQNRSPMAAILRRRSPWMSAISRHPRAPQRSRARCRLGATFPLIGQRWLTGPPWRVEHDASDTPRWVSHALSIPPVDFHLYVGRTCKNPRQFPAGGSGRMVSDDRDQKLR